MPYNSYPYQSLYPTYPQYSYAPQVNQVQSQQIQNGFVSVQSIEEAYNWPIAPGNSITFKIENSPYICTKTKGFSQLEQPTFEKYRLVKENEEKEPPKEIPEIDMSSYVLKKDFMAVSGEVENLKSELEALKDDLSVLSSRGQMKSREVDE